MAKRVRKNVNLSTDAVRRGKELAKHQKRSYSGVVEVAIDEAYERVFGKHPRKPAA